MVDQLFEGNRAFRENDLAPNRAFYEALATGQKPSVLWIGCSDSRVTPERSRLEGGRASSCTGTSATSWPPLDLNAGTVLEYGSTT